MSRVNIGFVAITVAPRKHKPVEGNTNMSFDNAEMIKKLRQSIPEQMAKDILGVQPMPNTALKELWENSMSEEELIEAGYEPVCAATRLMWRKK